MARRHSFIILAVLLFCAVIPAHGFAEDRAAVEARVRAAEIADGIGANINQLAKWANTYKRAVEAVEILTALASLEREIGAFMAAEKTEDEA
jgi:hypothetical protein